MTELVEVKICNCKHSPADHVHEKYMCCIRSCSCKEYNEVSLYMQLTIDPIIKRIER